MIDRKLQRPLHLFTVLACAAMTTKLVFFTEFNTRHPGPHVFSDIQAYADKKLDEFFGVETIRDKAAAESGPPHASEQSGSAPNATPGSA